MSRALSRSLLINTLWSFAGRFGYMSIGLVSNIVLARLLSPTEFGQVAIMMFFIIIAGVLAESGLAGALVRKQDAEEIDYSTVFVFNAVVSIMLMAALMGAADHVAVFYEDDKLAAVLRVASLVLLINALRVAQTVRLVKDLKFKEKSKYEVVAIAVSSVVAIIMARLGAGIWSLVALQLVFSLGLTVILWWKVGPVKSVKFSMDSFKEFYAFGINTTLASLLHTSFDNVYQLVFAKYFSMQHAGFYYQAKKLQEVPTSIFQSAALGVVYSALSRVKDSSEDFEKLYTNSTKLFTLAIGMVCMLIYFYAELAISMLYGGDWVGAAIYLKLLIVAAFFYMQEIFNRVVFKVYNRTGLILKLEIIKKIVQFGTIMYGVYVVDPEVMLYGFVIVSFFGFAINYYFSQRIRDQERWDGFLLIIKIFGAASLVVLLMEWLRSVMDMGALTSLGALPVMIVLFVMLLQCCRAINLREDVKNVLCLLRGL